MAEIAVNFVIEKLGPLLAQEMVFLSGVREEIRDIKLELESMRSFLKDADARAALEDFEEGERNHGVKTWVKQVREEAYHIEDVIDERVATVGIEGIKLSLANIQRRAQNYSFTTVEQGFRNIVPHDSRVGSFFIEDDEVVGIESIREELTDSLVNGSPERSIVAIVGEGGLGKTTIAGKLFKNEAVKTHFDCRTWVTVGKEYVKRDLLKTIIREFFRVSRRSSTVEIHNMEEKELISMLREHLKDKTYMVVFDDVWKIDFWGDVEHALFDNKKSSRVVLTTRRMNVADFCRSSSFVQIHELQPLPPNEAWKLLCKKAVGPNSGGHCPSELKELSHEILAKCGGLPLAIVAVGGLLSTKIRVLSERRTLLDRLGSKLAEREPHLKDCNRVLCEGYYDLPHHLKSCLLYFGLFPQGCKINCARLMRLWIAEGFVQYRKRPTSEQIAEECLNELIDRSLVQVSERSISGRARTCLVHDLMYEIITRKAKELGFCCAQNEENLSYCRNTRRILMNRNSDGIVEGVKYSKNIRSVFLSNGDHLPDPLALDTIVADFKLIKVLNLEGAHIDYLPEGVGNLFHLHYLSVKDTKVKRIPKSIGKLLNLETLDLKCSLVRELPVEIRNLKKLRYLMVYQLVYGSDGSRHYGEGAKIHEGFGFLTDLQTLSFVQANSETLKELRKLKQLKKLGIRLTNGNGKDLCALIAKLENLEVLDLHSTKRDEILDIQYLAPPPHHLRHLYLLGIIRKLPDWIFNLKNLTKLGLVWSALTDDPLRVLQALPNLLELRLIETYNYDYLHFKEGWFPKLQNLTLWDFKAVKSVKIEKGAMPNLRELGIGPCSLLKEIPTGIEHLRNLKILTFWDAMKKVYGMTKDPMWEKATEHIPEIRVYFKRADNDDYCTTRFLSSLSPEDFEKFTDELNTSNEQSHF